MKTAMFDLFSRNFHGFGDLQFSSIVQCLQILSLEYPGTLDQVLAVPKHFLPSDGYAGIGH